MCDESEAAGEPAAIGVELVDNGCCVRHILKNITLGSTRLFLFRKVKIE